MAHQTNNPVPVADYTGRQDPGKGYLNEYDVLQRDLENLGIFPVAPGFGSSMSELGDMILYSSTGRSGAIDRVNNLDRYASLPFTWIGQAAQEFGGLLSMTPEELMQLRKSINALVSNDPSAREDLWEGVKEAGRNYQSDPMSVAEDFGGGVPGIAIAAPKVAGKLLKGLGGGGDVGGGGGKVKGAEHIPHKPRQGVVDEELEPDMSMVTSPEAQYVIDSATGTRKSLPKIVDPDEWSEAGMQEFLDADVVPENWNPGDSKDLTSEGVKKSDAEWKAEHEGLASGKTEPLPDSMIRDLTDESLDLEIRKSNWTINDQQNTLKNPSLNYLDEDLKGMQEDLKQFKIELEKLVEERHKRQRRKDKGEGGSAGAQKTQTEVQQMMQIERKVQPKMKDITPVGGLHHEYFNKGAFDRDADLGNIDRLLGQGKFVSKRNTWHFPEDADPAVFSLNAFMSRMYQHQHKASSDEVIILMDILERTQNLPSKRKLSSMAEDIYKMISGPTKKLLAKEYGGSSPLGFDF